MKKFLSVVAVILGCLVFMGAVLAAAGFLVFLARAYLPNWLSTGVLLWASVICIFVIGIWAYKQRDFLFTCACAFGFLGGIMNGIVILANNFRMPFAGSTILAEGPLEKVYVSAADNTVRLFFLGDQIPFLGALLSPGDMLLGLALLFDIAAFVNAVVRVFLHETSRRSAALA